MNLFTGFVVLFCFVFSTSASLCHCNQSTIWLDVYILFDGSTALTAAKFPWMVTQVRYAFKTLTIGQALKYQTRVGVIVYGDNVNERAELTSFHSFDELMALDVPYRGSECSDLKGAIDLARDGFEKNHLNNRKKLLIIASGGYRQCNYDSPKASAETFKTNNGTIMVLTFEDSVYSNDLRQLATPNYFMNATNGVVPNTLYNMFCQANCYCPCLSDCSAVSDQWIASGGDPNNGCYMSESPGGIEYLSKKTCSDWSGILAMPKLSGDCLSVLNGFKTVDDKKNGIWIGLENNGTVDRPDWRWLDGTQPTSDILSQLKASNGNCCVLASTNGFLFSYNAMDCEKMRPYSCYIDPCSSDNYCENGKSSF